MAAISTMMVKVKASGQVVRINTTDFDSNLHDTVEKLGGEDQRPRKPSKAAEESPKTSEADKGGEEGSEAPKAKNGTKRRRLKSDE